MNELDDLTGLAMELQALAQNGLTYTKDRFDRERFERIREISAEMMAMKTGYPIETVKSLFCAGMGYQTPKLDTRAAVFEEGRILLVQEKGKWALPGGWMDFDQTVASNAKKEVKEEAGLDVEPVKIIAIQDRNRHNVPKLACSICKVFVLCEPKGGAFSENPETTDSGYFPLDGLPELDEDKTTYEQVEMCFAALKDANWQTAFD